MVCPHAYVQQLKHRPPFAGSLPPEPHAELFHLVVAGLRSVRQAQVLVFLLDRVVSDRVHPGNGIHELPPSLSLAGSSQPGCPDGYAGPRPVAAPRSAAVMKRVLMPHCPTDSAVRWPDASCRLPRGLYRLGTAPGSFGEAARSARQDVSQPNCGVFCNQPRAARIRCFQSNTRAWLAPDELSFG